jgi:bifunctional non-homologous end joining protein LigD
MSESASIALGRRRVKISNVDKKLYPDGFTKGQVLDYYMRVAPTMLRHTKGRAITLKRYPNGTTKPFFFEKNCNEYRPEWVKTAKIEGRTGDVTNHCVINDSATLLWAANLAALELHVPLALAKTHNRPTVMVFDLDPGPGFDIVDCCELGLDLRDLLHDLGLECFPKTSGSKGLHVYVPLNTPKVTFDDTKRYAQAVALLFHKQHPDRVTSNMSKQERGGKIFIDWSQNDHHKTTVCVYSLRAKDRPTVSTPVTWDEVKTVTRKRDAKKLVFLTEDVLRRIDKHGDLFEPVLKLKQRLPTNF